MEGTPKFIRAFSRQHSQEERATLATDLRTKRKEYFEKKARVKEHLRFAEESLGEVERERKEIMDRIESLNAELQRLSSNFLMKWKNYFEIQNVRAAISGEAHKAGELIDREMNARAERRDLEMELAQMPGEYQEVQQRLERFYEEEKDKWTNTDFNREDIEEQFSEEHLASLSLEEYTLLLQRFPSEMVTHVTRQGIRDHVGHMYHTVGRNTYSDNFMRLLEDGRLRSTLGLKLLEDDKLLAVAKSLKLDKTSSKEEALARLDQMLHPKMQNNPGSYADDTAVHFASEEVANAYYGAERGNEIFIAFPSAFIASQYSFKGNLTSGGSGGWNDVWVWQNEQKGMDLNAGIVFIPKNAPVDKHTGSRYQLDKDKNAIPNDELQTKLQTCLADLEKQGIKDVNEATEYLQKNGISRDVCNQLRKHGTLESLLAMPDARDEFIPQFLESSGLAFVPSQDTISSEEFWENYFLQFPDKKPNKIVYYEGEDPTAALHQWREDNDLNKRSTESDFGFSERNMRTDYSSVLEDSERFKALAERAIEMYFQNNP